MPDAASIHYPFPRLQAYLGKTPIGAAPRAFGISQVPIPKNRYFVATHGLTTTVCTVYLVDLLGQSHTAQQYRTVQLYHLLSETQFYAVFAILCILLPERQKRKGVGSLS